MAGLNHGVFHLYNFGGLPIFTWNNPHKNWQKPGTSPRFTKGTCYLPILKSLGMAFPMVTRCLWWIPILNGKNKASNTTLSPPQKKKLRKNWGGLSLLLNAFFQVTFVHFQGGNFWSYTWIKYDKILLHQSEPEAHVLRCTHLMRNEPVSLLYLLGHGTHTSWDVPMFMEFLQDLQHQAEHQSQNLMTSSLFNVQGDLFPFFVIDMKNSQRSIMGEQHLYQTNNKQRREISAESFYHLTKGPRVPVVFLFIFGAWSAIS